MEIKNKDGISIYISENRQSVDLSDKNIIELGYEMCSLIYCTHLYLNNNNLQRIFYLPPNLIQLEISNNFLSEFPTVIIDGCKDIEIINLENNQIINIPPRIRDITNLKLLSLSNNSITEVPYEFVHLNKLSCLDLSFNDIETISTDIMDYFDIENLKYLYFEGNPLNIETNEKLKQIITDKYIRST